MTEHPQMTPVEAAEACAGYLERPANGIDPRAFPELRKHAMFALESDSAISSRILAGEVRRLHEELYSIASTTEVPDATAESITGEFKRKKIELESAHSENKRLRALVPQWQPIETAPKDVLLRISRHVQMVGRWSSIYGRWRSQTCRNKCEVLYPTHWAPLPPSLNIVPHGTNL